MKPSFSVGTDIVDVIRIGRLARNKRFLERVYSAEEVRYCKSKKFSAQHFAVRFAAKEAVWKTLSPIVKLKGISHREISVKNGPTGQPLLQLSARLKKYEKRVSLSLSHTREYAVAVVIYHPA